MHSSTFTTVETVEMNHDIFLGGCSFDTTEQHIIDHVTSKGIRVINCVSIEANVRWYKPFKITVSPNDRDKLLSPSLWPVNIFVRKFHNDERETPDRSLALNFNLLSCFLKDTWLVVCVSYHTMFNHFVQIKPLSKHY